MLNIYFSNKIKSTNYFGSIDDFLLVEQSLDTHSTLEIMVHVMFNHHNQIIDYDGSEIAHKLLPLINMHKVITYNDL